MKWKSNLTIAESLKENELIIDKLKDLSKILIETTNYISYNVYIIILEEHNFTNSYS